VLATLDSFFQDNVKGRKLQADGTWRRKTLRKGEEPFRVQIETYRQAQRALGKARARTGVSLEPLAAPEGVA